MRLGISILIIAVLMAGGVSAGIYVILPNLLPTAAMLGATSDVPATISHQGVVAVSGTRFNGSGAFKFAILDPDTGSNVWTSSADTAPADGVPDTGTSLTVSDGVYSVKLGAAPMAPITRSIFADGNLQLRIWFDGGTGNWQQLSPDHELTSVPYSFNVADATITTAKLAPAVAEALAPVGTIVATARSTAPAGWLMCDGTAVSQTTYAELFAALGGAASPYGGISGGNFSLPDLRGRVPVGVDGAASRLTANDSLGNTGGEEKHTLDVTEMPAHSHTISNHTHTVPLKNGGSQSEVGGTQGYAQHNAWESGNHITSGVNSGNVIANTGGGAAHNIMQPYQVVNYIIKH